MKKLRILVFSLIVFLAAGLRLFQLDQSPPSLYWDEVAIGYNAYSILTTGRDEYGRFLPAVFESFSEFKAPGMIYLTVPFVAGLGLNTWAVRLPSALAGIAAVIIIYFLVQELFNSNQFGIGIITSFLLAISPWHLQFSRAGFEANLALTLVMAGILFLLKARVKPALLFASGICFCLALYFYHGFKLFIPVFLGLWWLFLKPVEFKKLKTHIFKTLILSLILLIPFFWSLKSSLLGRGSQVETIIDPYRLEESIQLKQVDANSLLSRLIHHRFLAYGQNFIKNYLSYFSTDFLFFVGDGNQRHSSGPNGLFYFWQLPFMLLGALVLYQQKQAKELWLWLGLAPAAAALFYPSPHALRALPLAPVLVILVSLGLVETYIYLKQFKFLKLGFLALLVLVLVWEAGLYLNHYYGYYPQLAANAWAQPYSWINQQIKSRRSDYQKIYISGYWWRPYIFSLFYQQVEPGDYINQGNHSHFGRFYFGHASFDPTDKYYDYTKTYFDDLKAEPGNLFFLENTNGFDQSQIIDQVQINDQTVFMLTS